MLSGQTLWLAVNPASGSNNDAALAELEEGFGRCSCPIARTLHFPDEGVPSLEELRAAGVDILAIFTGDGSMNSIVAGLSGWDGAVLVLPGGTMNLLAKRLHGDCDAAEIIARIGEGRVRRERPTIVRTPYGDGLTGVLAGPGTAWNQVREAMREADVVGLVGKAAEAIGESTGGPKVVNRIPPPTRPEGYSLIMISPTDDGLEGDGYYAETIADYAKQGMALLRRNFREGPHESLGLSRTYRLACVEEEPMGLLIDGEPCDAAAEEEFTLARSEVDLLATLDA